MNCHGCENDIPEGQQRKVGLLGIKASFALTVCQACDPENVDQDDISGRRTASDNLVRAAERHPETKVVGDMTMFPPRRTILDTLETLRKTVAASPRTISRKPGPTFGQERHTSSRTRHWQVDALHPSRP